MSQILLPWLRRVLVSLALLVFISALVVVWLFRTQSGAQQIVNLALSQIGQNITVREVSGSISDGVELTDIHFASEGGSIHVDSMDLSVDASDLLKRSLRIRNIGVEGVTIIRSEPESASEPDDLEPGALPNLDLPLDIIVEQVNVKNVAFGNSSEDLSTLIEQLTAVADWTGTTVTLSKFEARSQLGQASATASLTTAGSYPVLIIADTTLTPDGIAPLRSSTQLSGSLRELIVDHSSASPYALAVKGTVREPLTSPDLDVQVNAVGANLAEISETLPDVSLTGEINLSGSVGRLAAHGQLAGEIPGIGNSRADFESTLSSQRLQLNALTVELPDVEGKPVVRANGDIRINQNAPLVDLAVDWDRLRWPLQGDLLVRSAKGASTLKGSINAYELLITSDIATRYGQDGTIKLSASGDSERIRIDTVRAQVLEGTISGQGEIVTAGNLSFSANLQGNGLNPRGLSTSWPGKLNFNLEGTGTALDTGITAKVTRLVGKGELRGYPVQFDGRGQVTPKGLYIDRLDLRSGDTAVRALGEITERLSLEWSVNSDDLSSLWPGLKGTLEAQGKTGGTLTSPTIDVALKGGALEYKDMAVDKLDATIVYDEADAANGSAIFSASDLSLGTYKPEQLIISARGAIENHTIHFGLTDGLGESLVQIEGALIDSTQYQFNLTDITLNPPDLGVWALAQPSSGMATRTSISLDETCLGQGSSRLCVSLDTAQNRLAAHIDIAQVPLSLISNFIPISAKASGTLDGGGDILVSTDGDSSGNVSFEFSSMAIASKFKKDERESTLRFGPSTLTATVDDLGGLDLTASFPLLSGGGLGFTGAVVGGEQPLFERAMSGDLSVSVSTLAFVSDYIPQISRAEGRIDGAIKLSGSIRRPELLGNFELDKGALTLVDPGIQATDVSIKLTGNQNNSFSLTGSAKSGGGKVTLDGILELSESGNTGQFNVSGRDFQVLNTQEAQIWASPDLSLEYKDESLKLTGSVLIPKAKIEIDELPKGTSKVSKDQVIIGQQETEVTAVIPMSGVLELELGDDVHLSAFGLDASLEGAVTIEEHNNKPATASGEIKLIDGKYRAYGQRLTITTGRLIYAGGRLDEPGIDLRATRKPTVDIEVGISARGPISQPSFSVFSSPPMSESDQLAYLIFGRPINAEASSESTLVTRAVLTLGMKGGEALTQKLADELGVDQLGIESQGSGDLSQASLVIGKYLSPKLFVSYGIGVLEPVSTLKLEYALSSRWQLVTESSTTRSSADAQFTYER